MNEELTQEQKQQLVSWVSQRDSILVDIANKRVEQEQLTLSNKNLAASNAEIQGSISRSIGRLEELDKLEKEYEEIVSTTLATTLVQKTQLETEIQGLKKEISLLECERITLVGMFGDLKEIHAQYSKDANDINRAVGETVQKNSQMTTEISNLLITLKDEIKKVIDVNTANVEKTNVVINDLPRIIFDLQRELFERKKFNKIKQQ